MPDSCCTNSQVPQKYYSFSFSSAFDLVNSHTTNIEKRFNAMCTDHPEDWGELLLASELCLLFSHISKYLETERNQSQKFANLFNNEHAINQIPESFITNYYKNDRNFKANFNSIREEAKTIIKNLINSDFSGSIFFKAEKDIDQQRVFDKIVFLERKMSSQESRIEHRIPEAEQILEHSINICSKWQDFIIKNKKSLFNIARDIAQALALNGVTSYDPMADISENVIREGTLEKLKNLMSEFQSSKSHIYSQNKENIHSQIEKLSHSYEKMHNLLKYILEQEGELSLKIIKYNQYLDLYSQIQEKGLLEIANIKKLPSRDEYSKIIKRIGENYDSRN